MDVQVSKWGNSLAIRIPHKMAEALNLLEGTAAALSLKNGKLLVAPKNKKYDLDALLSGITEENTHIEEDFGQMGKELL